MDKVKEYIESGILDLYALGLTSAEETLEVSAMATSHIEIRDEIDAIVAALKLQAEQSTKRQPNLTLKPFLMATIDYMERMKSGEPESIPPLLNPSSRITDFSEWINRPDFQFPEDFSEFYAKIIGNNIEATTAIAWIKTGAPGETHHNESERFLVLEGSCDIKIGETVHRLKVGDFMQIPLHEDHVLMVTSTIPCKVILQRVAA